MKKRTRWWNDEVQFAIRRKKILYKEMLNADTEEARQRHSEAKSEARRVVRKARNEEWVQFGREMEKEAIGNQRKFWMRVKEDRRPTRGGTHINNKDGQLLTDQTKSWTGGRSTLKAYFRRLKMQSNQIWRWVRRATRK